MFLLQNLPSFHVKVRMATVTPRILPSSDHEIRDMRDAMERALDKLLASPVPKNIDNAPPTNYGFSTGYFLAYQGHNNVMIKSKMYRVYLLYCPALHNGYFVDPTTGRRHSTSADDSDPEEEDEEFAVAVAAGDAGVGGGPVWGHEDEDADLFDGSAPASIIAHKHPSAPSIASGGGASRLGDGDGASTDCAAGCVAGAVSSTVLQTLSEDNARLLRVGIASRHLFSHQVGYLFEGMISQLGQAGFLLEVFLIDGYIHNTSDPVYSSILQHVNAVHPLTAELTVFIRAVREAKVDILIYPDLGLDPIPFFAAFTRLAPIQVTGLGHVDTSGLDTVDYYVSDSSEVTSPLAAEAHYSETLIRMKGMGTCFVDRFLEYATALQSPRTGLLERAKYIESIGEREEPYRAYYTNAWRVFLLTNCVIGICI
jgi:hypothetical protein